MSGHVSYLMRFVPSDATDRERQDAFDDAVRHARRIGHQDGRFRLFRPRYEEAR